MTRTLPFLALTGLVALSGCAGLGTFGDRYGDHRDGGYYENDRYGDYYDSGYARRVEHDARAYADGLDRYLRISNREERAVREVLEYRTYELLERTRVRDHDRVYPFPRRRGRAERFWALADRDIQRILDRRYHEPYAYYNRYGAERYNEYYRYRRYDDRRGWVDTRRESRRTERRAEKSRDRRDDAREDRRAEQREAARRRADRRERVEQDRRRDQERRASQDRERRRERADRDRERRRAEKAKEKTEKDKSRRRSRRGGNN